MTVLATMNITASFYFSVQADQILTGRAIANATFDASAAAYVALKGNYRLRDISDDTISLGFRIMSGATVLAAGDAGGAFQIIMTVGPNDATLTNYSAHDPFPVGNGDGFEFDYVNTGASQAQWDAATAEGEQIYDNNMGGDGGRWYPAANQMYLEVGNSNRDVICTTGTIKYRTKEAAVWRGYNTGDPLLALVGQDGTNASTGPSGWTLETATNNSTVRLELWSKEATASNDFDWTPGSGQTLHVMPLTAPLYTYSTIGWQTFVTGNSTAPNSPAPVPVKKYVTVGGGFVIDAPAGNLTVSNACTVHNFVADYDLDLGAGLGQYNLPYEAWKLTGDLDPKEETRYGESFGTTKDCVMPTGTPGSAIRDYNRRYNGTSWSYDSSILVPRYHHSSAGVSADSGLIVGGWDGSGLTVKTEEYNGSTWAYGGDCTLPARDTHTGGAVDDCMKTGGTDPSNSVKTTEEYNGTSWVASDDMGVNRSGHLVTGNGVNDIFCIGGYDNSTAPYVIITTEDYNGTAWASNVALLNNWCWGGGGGDSLSDVALACGSSGTGASTIARHDRFDGVAWAVGSTPITSRRYVLGGGNNAGNMMFCGGQGTSNRNAAMYESGPQPMTHAAQTAGNWVAATFRVEIDDPRDVVCTSGAIEYTGNHAQVGLNVLATPGAVGVTGEDAIIIRGDASYPISFSTTGVIAGTTATVFYRGFGSVDQGRPVVGDSEAIEVTGNQASVTITRDVAGAGAIAVTGNQATVFKGVNRAVVCSTGAIVLAGNDAGVVTDRLVAGGTEAIAVVGNIAQVSKATQRDVTCSTAQIVIATAGGSVAQDRPITGQAAIAYGGNSATVVKDNYTYGSTGIINVVGTMATVTAVPTRTVICTTCEVVWRGTKGDLPWLPFRHKMINHFPVQLIHQDLDENILYHSDQDAAEGGQYGHQQNDSDSMLWAGGKHLRTTAYSQTSMTIVGNAHYSDKVPLFDQSTLQFDGSDTYVYDNVITGLDNEDHCVFSGWFKPLSVAGTQTLFTTRFLDGSASGGMEVQMDGAHVNLYAYDDAGDMTTDSSGEANGVTMVANEWQFVWASLNNGSTVYNIWIGKKGEPMVFHKAIAKGGSSGTAGFVGIRIGRGDNATPQNFSGAVGDFAVSPVRWYTSPDTYPPVEGMRFYQNNAFDYNSWKNTTKWWAGNITYRDDMGGWISDWRNQHMGYDGTSFTAFHRLTTSYTLEVLVELYQADHTIMDNTTVNLSAIGVYWYVKSDGTMGYRVQQFNQSSNPVALIETAPGAITFDTPQRICVTYNLSADTFALRIEGVVVATGSTLVAPPGGTNAQTDIYYARSVSEQVRLRDIRMFYYDIYGYEDTIEHHIPIRRSPRIVSKSRLVECTTGQIVLIGNDALITTANSRYVYGLTGSVEVLGNTATIGKVTEQPRDVVCTTGGIEYASLGGAVSQGRDAIGSPSPIVMVGNQATLIKDKQVTGQTGAIVLIGQPAQVSKAVNRDVNGSTEVLIVTGNLATIGRTRDVSGSGAIVYTGQAVVTVSRNVVCQPGQVVISGIPAQITISRDVISGASEIVITGTPANVDASREVQGVTEAIVIVGTDALVSAGRNVGTLTEQLVVHGNQATVIKDVRGGIEAETGAITITGTQALVSKRTNTGSLPYYNNVGVATIVPQTAPDLLSPEVDDVRVLTGVGVIYGIDEPDILLLEDAE